MTGGSGALATHANAPERVWCPEWSIICGRRERGPLLAASTATVALHATRTRFICTQNGRRAQNGETRWRFHLQRQYSMHPMVTLVPSLVSVGPRIRHVHRRVERCLRVTRAQIDAGLLEFKLDCTFPTRRRHQQKYCNNAALDTPVIWRSSSSRKYPCAYGEQY